MGQRTPKESTVHPRTREPLQPPKARSQQANRYAAEAQSHYANLGRGSTEGEGLGFGLQAFWILRVSHGVESFRYGIRVPEQRQKANKLPTNRHKNKQSHSPRNTRVSQVVAFGEQ